jgi:hypothetical protein
MQRNISSPIGARCRASARCLGNMAQEHVGIAQRNAQTASQNAETVDQPSCARVSSLVAKEQLFATQALGCAACAGHVDYVSWWL